MTHIYTSHVRGSGSEMGVHGPPGGDVKPRQGVREHHRDGFWGLILRMKSVKNLSLHLLVVG
jgi:hypothetical protein